MRVSAVVVMLSLVFLAARCQPPHGGAEAASPTSAAALVGAWSGEWTAPTGQAHGPVELVLARVPGKDGVVGQFTFLTGGLSRTLRYEGRLEDGRLRFPLVGEGHVVLEPQAAARPGTAEALHGEWVDSRGALPAPRGTLHLSRAPVR